MHVDVGKTAIILVHPRLEDRRNLEAAHTRYEPGRGHAALRNDEHDRVTDADPELLCKADTNGHAIIPGAQRIDATFAQ